jgi:hypothetical protein
VINYSSPLVIDRPVKNGKNESGGQLSGTSSQGIPGIASSVEFSFNFFFSEKNLLRVLFHN